MHLFQNWFNSKTVGRISKHAEICTRALVTNACGPFDLVVFNDMLGSCSELGL